MPDEIKKPQLPLQTPIDPEAPNPATAATRPKEIGGPAGPEPTRYGDWEQKGRCTDF